MKNGLLILAVCLSGLPVPSCRNNKLVFIKEIETVAMASYGGFGHEDTVSFFNSVQVPFKVSDFTDDYIAVGDTLIVRYSGSWIIAESDPPQIKMKNLVIYDVEIKHTQVFELEVADNGGQKYLKSLDPAIEINESKINNGYGEDPCINIDYSFQNISTYEVGTKIWAAKYPWSNENDYYALYTFDIRVKKDFVKNCGV